MSGVGGIALKVAPGADFELLTFLLLTTDY
jgi:hypothetical protein